MVTLAAERKIEGGMEWGQMEERKFHEIEEEMALSLAGNILAPKAHLPQALPGRWAAWTAGVNELSSPFPPPLCRPGTLLHGPVCV